MKNQRFHLSDAAFSKNCDLLYKKAIADGKITQSDFDIIREFVGELAGRISASREYKIVGSLILNREFFPEYSTCKTADVQTGIRKIVTAEISDGVSRYTANTKTDRVKISKRFFLWMCDNGYGDLSEKKLNKIVPPRPDKMTKTAADILTEEEVHRIKEACTNSRDRALISVLYEGGFRAAEVGSLTWNDIKFTKWSVIINTDGKTGAPRYVPLVESRSYLAQWMCDYPWKPSPDDFVFLTITTHKPITYAATAKQIRNLSSVAGIDKKITPHIFRHSRITHLIQQGVPETHIKKMMWGNLTTDMFQTYAHITNSDVDNCIAEFYNISRPEIDEDKKKRKKILEPRQCPECGAVNGSTLNYCGTCGTPLTDEARNASAKAKEDLQKLLEDPSMLVETIELSKVLRAAKMKNDL